MFNGIFWKHLLESGQPAGADGRIALPVAGADGQGKRIVLDVVDELRLERREALLGHVGQPEAEHARVERMPWRLPAE